jgi:hypothetical protein
MRDSLNPDHWSNWVHQSSILWIIPSTPSSGSYLSSPAIVNYGKYILFERDRFRSLKPSNASTSMRTFHWGQHYRCPWALLWVITYCPVRRRLLSILQSYHRFDKFDRRLGTCRSSFTVSCIPRPMESGLLQWVQQCRDVYKACVQVRCSGYISGNFVVDFTRLDDTRVPHYHPATYTTIC